jgi:hypothetical protein
MGFAGVALDSCHIQMLGEGAASIDAGWRALVKPVPIEFRALYICHNTANGWRIFAAQAYRRAGDT